MQNILSMLPKPSRYIGIEEGSVHKPLESVALHMALAFPDMYEVGMSYLGDKILYAIVNDRPEWYAERVFTPCREGGAILQQHDTPLSTLESKTPLAALDAVGFSITHELCYTNVLYMLDLAGIPLYAKDRDTANSQFPDKPWPIIMAGGGCTMCAEPLAPFIDLMMLGEGEELLSEVLELLEECRKKGLSRKQFLQKARYIPSVYVPEFFVFNPENNCTQPIYDDYTAITRRVIPDMNDAPYPSAQPIPFGAVHNRLALEIGRGCTRGCRFCQAGAIYRPARERSIENLEHLLHSCLTDTGFDDVSFLSLSSGDFSALKTLFMNTVDRCAHEQISVSLPSLRVGSIDDAIMERMAGIRRTGATLAPEAGSQRLRDVINKGITEEELILHMQKLFEHGWQQVKLYFMIGLPTETDEDILAILDLCRKARDSAGPGIKRMQITASLSPFVPKPHTPFQWAEQISLEEIRRRIGLLLDAIKHEKRIKLRWHEPDMSVLEGIFSRGDRRLAPVVEAAYRKGAIFSSWMDGFSLSPWLDALSEHNLTLEEFTRERSLEEDLPWDHLHSGLSKQFFRRELERAHKQTTVADCRYATCLQCGVCDTKTGFSLLDKPTNASPGQFGLPDAFKGTSTDTPTYTNRLNFAQRDQSAHSVKLDEYGRVIVRSHGEPGKPKQVGKGKQRPPQLADHLVHKAAQYTITYSRKNEAVFLSQLEIQAIVERALRRAKLPLTFSQGYHPLPLLSFGRALPIGVASEREWFSVYLSEKRAAKEIYDSLSGLPVGMKVTSVEEQELKTKNRDPEKELYTIELLSPLADGASFADIWEKLQLAPELIWHRETKKGVREINARKYFGAIQKQGDKFLLTLDWSQGYISPLALCLATMNLLGYTVGQNEILLTLTDSTQKRPD